jgi:hypothetical protein
VEQPNARAKVANAAWRTSDRYKSAVPTSRRPAFISVSSALQSGVRTDEMVCHHAIIKNNMKQGSSGQWSLQVYRRTLNLLGTDDRVNANLSLGTESPQTSSSDDEELRSGSSGLTAQNDILQSIWQ